jgi:hypothetical protein
MGILPSEHASCKIWFSGSINVTFYFKQVFASADVSELKVHLID